LPLRAGHYSHRLQDRTHRGRLQENAAGKMTLAVGRPQTSSRRQSVGGANGQPQALKRNPFQASIGTTKVVPFPKSRTAEVSGSLKHWLPQPIRLGGSHRG
jgi:hypothetical protein